MNIDVLSMLFTVYTQRPFSRAADDEKDIHPSVIFLPSWRGGGE